VRFDPSFPKNNYQYEIEPSSQAYVPILYDDNFPDGLLCNHAYTSEDEAKKHFWFREKKSKAKIISMTVEEFLRKMDVQGMNPFETINRVEFIQKYAERWGIRK
jgi:hypothetical protein